MDPDSSQLPELPFLLCWEQNPWCRSCWVNCHRPSCVLFINADIKICMGNEARGFIGPFSRLDSYAHLPGKGGQTLGVCPDLHCKAHIPTLLVAACCLQVSIALWTVDSPSGEFPELLGEFLRCHVTDHFH